MTLTRWLTCFAYSLLLCDLYVGVDRIIQLSDLAIVYVYYCYSALCILYYAMPLHVLFLKLFDFWYFHLLWYIVGKVILFLEWSRDTTGRVSRSAKGCLLNGYLILYSPPSILKCLLSWLDNTTMHQVDHKHASCNEQSDLGRMVSNLIYVTTQY
jgi:hypothetical protein